MTERKIRIRKFRDVEVWTLRLTPLKVSLHVGEDRHDDCSWTMDPFDRVITVRRQRKSADTAALVAHAILAAVNRHEPGSAVDVDDPRMDLMSEREGRNVA